MCTRPVNIFRIGLVGLWLTGLLWGQPGHAQTAGEVTEQRLMEYYGRKEYDRALEVARKLGEQLREKKGAEHTDTIRMTGRVAVLLDLTGKPDEALPLHEKTLALRRKTSGEKSVEVADVYNNLAIHHLRRGDKKKAEELFETSLALRQELLGVEHPDIASTLNNLAVVLEESGNRTKAILYLRLAVKIYEKSSGPDSAESVQARKNLRRLQDAEKSGGSEP